MRHDAVLSGVVLLLFSALFVQALGFRWEAAVAPLLATGAGMILSLSILVRLVLARRTASNDPAIYDRTDASAFAGFLAAAIIIGLLGFKIGAALYVFGYMLAVPRCSFRNALLFAVPVPFVTVFLIEKPLSIQLYSGFLLN